MTPSLPFVVAVFAAPAAELPTELWQVAPDRRGLVWADHPREKDRAVLLIPGLKIHPFRPVLATRPELNDWQLPAGELVRGLAKDFDVFAFGYAQTVPLDAVAHAPGLRDAVARIKAAGYKEIVLIGHSAGAVIARLFSERYPDAGARKVIAVAGPHAGAELANVKIGYSKAQAPFIQSLAPGARAEAGGVRKPNDTLEMACVVCKIKRLEGDGLVSLGSQWPRECQRCGVPAVLATVSHFDAMLNPTSTRAIAALAREKVTRWGPGEVEKARKVLFGSD